MEYWQILHGYDYNYEVSNCGNVRYENKIFNQHFDRVGYKKINLRKDGKQNIFLVHRLVAQAFISNPNNLPAVNHIDGNKSNNRVDNLEWCTDKHNMRHAIKTGLLSTSYSGKDIGQWDLDGNFITSYEHLVDAAKAAMTDHSNISKCIIRNKGTVNGFIWRLINHGDVGNKIPEKELRWIVGSTAASKVVLQYDLDGNLLDRFPSCAYAGRYIGNAESAIRHCLLGDYTSSHGFIWKYEQELGV